MTESPLLYAGSVTLDVDDVARASRFWCAALGYVVGYQDESWTMLKHPSRRGAVRIVLQKAEAPKRPGEANRAHLDLYTDDREREARRLEGLGARRLDWPWAEGGNFLVMADPDGNELCVVELPRDRLEMA